VDFDRLAVALSRRRLMGSSLAAAVATLPMRAFAQESSSVTRFVLVDADTDQDIGVLSDGAVIDPALFPVNVRAETTPENVGPVAFFVDGALARTENNPVYALFGNTGSNYEPGAFAPGGHTLAAEIANGGTGLSVSFSVGVPATETPEPTATPVPPTHTPEPTTTNTPVPPTETPTLEPTATNTATAQPTNTPTQQAGLAICSQALHDSYVATGPDGNAYATWHPLVDTENGQPCTHRHEHGTNPAHLHPSWVPLFGYTAAKHGMPEAHVGFKVAVVQGTLGPRSGMLYHQGTASLNRVCVRHHTMGFAFLAADGSLGAEINFMGDFGKAVHNDTFTVDPGNATLTPTACPNQGSTGGSTGLRQIPGPSGTQGYEPWRMGSWLAGSNPRVPATRLGLIGGMTFNVRTGIANCNDLYGCNTPKLTGRTGANRFVTPNDACHLDASKAIATGVFYTDPSGRNLRQASDPDAVRQFVTPGLKTFWSCSGHATGRSQGRMLVCGESDGYDINETINGVSAIPPNGPN
jgi:hypothetical protein